MSIKVSAQVRIDRPRAEVAGFATNPDNDPTWITGIVEARMLTEPPLAEGTQVLRVATFLGKRIEYINQVTHYDPEASLSMRSIKGPFPMVVQYDFEEAFGGGTLARVTLEGEATGFFRLAGPVVSRAAKRNITNDLETLKDLLESGADLT